MHYLDLIKKIIKKVCGHKGVKSDIYLPLLQESPNESAFILVVCENTRSIWRPQDIFVNDKVVSVLRIVSCKRSDILVCQPDAFDRWENVVALPLCARPTTVRLVSVPKIVYAGDASGLPGKILNELVDSGSTSSITEPSAGDSGVSKISDNESIYAAVTYLRRSLNCDEGSPFRGTFYTAFDLESRGYRVLSWVWTSAVVLRALIGEVAAAPRSGLQEDLKCCGQALLSRQISSGESKGGYMVRWDIWPQARSGVVPWLSPNDAGFIGANGLLPMYEFTGDERYLLAARRLVEWIMGPGTRADGLVYVGYNMEQERWVDDWLYVDAAFTVVLFERLYWVDKDEHLRVWVERFIKEFIVRFRLENGLFRAFLRNKKEQRDHIFTRGQAWVMDALLSTYRLLQWPKALEMAVELARALEPHQAPSGAWYYSLYKPESGEDAKANPILAYHLLDLYSLAPDTRFKQMATRALDWCRNHQVPVRDPLAGGGIYSNTIEGTIAGKRNVPVIFSYSVAYYILALRKLQDMTE